MDAENVAPDFLSLDSPIIELEKQLKRQGVRYRWSQPGSDSSCALVVSIKSGRKVREVAEKAWSRQAIDHAERLHPLVGGGSGSDGRHDGGDSERCALRVPSGCEKRLTSQPRKSAVHLVRG